MDKFAFVDGRRIRGQLAPATRRAGECRGFRWKATQNEKTRDCFGLLNRKGRHGADHSARLVGPSLNVAQGPKRLELLGRQSDALRPREMLSQRLVRLPLRLQKLRVLLHQVGVLLVHR